MDGTIALLAAGASRRMRGADKLLQQVAGRPLLRLLAERALATGWPLRVTLPPRTEARRAALAGLPADLVTVPEAGEGMAASFRALAGTGTPVLVMLADMPEIETADLAALIAAHRETPETPLRAATEDGRPGQPVLFPAHLVPRFADLSGDTGGRPLLEAAPPRLVPLPGTRALTDLDTPEAWAAWRAR